MLCLISVANCNVVHSAPIEAAKAIAISSGSGRACFIAEKYAYERDEWISDSFQAQCSAVMFAFLYVGVCCRHLLIRRCLLFSAQYSSFRHTQFALRNACMYATLFGNVIFIAAAAPKANYHDSTTDTITISSLKDIFLRVLLIPENGVVLQWDNFGWQILFLEVWINLRIKIIQISYGDEYPLYRHFEFNTQFLYQ